MPRFRLLLGALFAAVLALAALPSRAENFAPGEASVQGCNTRCQSEFTDCVIACDGARACEQACKTTVARCVETCRR
jgi:hypothetical protein